MPEFIKPFQCYLTLPANSAPFSQFARFSGHLNSSADARFLICVTAPNRYMTDTCNTLALYGNRRLEPFGGSIPFNYLATPEI